MLVQHYIQASFFNQVGNSIGTGGLQIRINLTGTPETNPQDIFYLRHRPSWKVRKNVFSALKSHTLSNNQQQQIVPGTIPHGRVNNPNEGRIMAYSCDYDTQGEVTLAMGHGKKLDHMGIQVKFFGRIDMVSICRLYIMVWYCSTLCLSLFSIVIFIMFCRRLELTRVVQVMTLYHCQKNCYHLVHSLIHVLSLLTFVV